MDINERVIGIVAALDIRGRLYGSEAGCRLERTVERLGREGRCVVVANLEHVSAIDAGGIGALLAAYRASVRSGGAFKIVRASKRTRELLVVTRLSPILKTFNSIEDALHDPAAVPRARSSAVRWSRRSVAAERRSAGEGDDEAIDGKAADQQQREH